MWIGITILLFQPFDKVFFFWGRRLLDFGFLTEEASRIHRIFKICRHDKNNKKIQNRLKFEGLDWFSRKLLSNITQYLCIYAQNFSSINRNLSVRQFWTNFQKIQNLKKFNARIDFGQIQYQRFLIDIIYSCVVLGRQLKFYEK